MSEAKLHWLVIYDIRDPKRWRKVYRRMRGQGERIQFSVFRCRMTPRQMERLRWELEQRLEGEDSVLFVGLCDSCVARVVARNRPESWPLEEDPVRFKVV